MDGAAADRCCSSLGVHIDQVEFRSGASHLPDGGVAAGSGHSASAGLALRNASEHALARSPNSPRPIPPRPSSAPAMSASGRAMVVCVPSEDETRSDSFADILARAGRVELMGEAKAARRPSVAESRALYSHGAVFAEVKVDPDLGQIRVTRLVSALSPPAAHHQSSPGAQPISWRNDMGSVLRLAGGSDH